MPTEQPPRSILDLLCPKHGGKVDAAECPSCRLENAQPEPPRDAREACQELQRKCFGLAEYHRDLRDTSAMWRRFGRALVAVLGWVDEHAKGEAPPPQPSARQRFQCQGDGDGTPGCGLVAVDEDGLCRSCGADTIVVYATGETRVEEEAPQPSAPSPEKCVEVHDGVIVVGHHTAALQRRDYGPWADRGLNLAPSFRWHLVEDEDGYQVLVATSPHHLQEAPQPSAPPEWQQEVREWAIYCFTNHGNDAHLYNGLAALAGMEPYSAKEDPQPSAVAPDTTRDALVAACRAEAQQELDARGWNHELTHREQVVVSASVTACMSRQAQRLAMLEAERERLRGVVRACGLDPDMPIPGGISIREWEKRAEAAEARVGATGAPMTPSELASSLREAATVLDEPFHHDAIAAHLNEAADLLDQLSAPGVLVTTREKAEKAISAAMMAGDCEARMDYYCPTCGQVWEVGTHVAIHPVDTATDERWKTGRPPDVKEVEDMADDPR